MEPKNTRPDQTPASLSEAKRRLAQEEIAEAITRGLTITEACHLSDVSRQTFYHWLDTDETFRRHIAYAEEEVASTLEAALWTCADKAEDDPRYQRSLIYLLERRERRRERQADREHRAELLRMRLDHELRLQELATAQAEQEAKGNQTLPLQKGEYREAGRGSCPEDPEGGRGSDPATVSKPGSPRLTTPMRRGASIPNHLLPTRHLYRAAPGPLKPLQSPTHTGDGHSSSIPNLHPRP